MMRNLTKPLHFALLILGIVILTGCGGGAPEEPTPTTTPTEEPLIIEQPTNTPESVLTATAPPLLPTVEPSITPGIGAMPALGGPLNDTGPWLVYYDPDTDDLVAVNPDGTGRTPLHAPRPFVVGLTLDLHPSPTGDKLAYRAGSQTLPDPDLELIILSLPDGNVIDRIRLFGADWHAQMGAATLPTDRGTYEEDVVKAVWSFSSVAWSPDSKYLAFVGARLGPSSDVYAYNTEDGTSRRLTTGLNQSYDLNWSPDGAWIVHQEVVTFGTTLDWEVEALWAVDPMGEEAIKLLAEIPNTFVDRWVSDKTFIVYEWDAAMGPMYLKTVDLREEGATRFFRGPLRGHAYDPASSVVALYLDEVGAAEYDVVPGIYIEPRYGGPPTQVFEGAEHIALSLEWSDTYESFVAGLPNHVILFDREGQNLRVIEQGGVAKRAPNGWWLAVYAVDDRSPAGVNL
jgi:hypothetical protein